MDLRDIGTRFTPGYSLNVGEMAALEVQMQKRKVEEKLRNIKFFGRIQGTTADYLIACGLVNVVGGPVKKFYFCTSNNISLQQLPELSDEHAKIASTLSGRFLGNPSKLLGPDADVEAEEEEYDEEGNPLPRPVRFSEAHRLAYVVSEINNATAVVPIGAYSVDPNHYVIENPTFTGVSSTHAKDLSSYAHFRAPQNPSRVAALGKAALVPTFSFLDPISEDVPISTWKVQLDEGRGLVEIRSLLYPGYFFFAEVEGSAYGSIYVGNGLKNEYYFHN